MYKVRPSLRWPHYVISKTTSITAKILAEMNQEMGDLSATVLQNSATIHCPLLRHNLGCQQFPGMYCFDVSDFSHTVDDQISNLNKEA